MQAADPNSFLTLYRSAVRTRRLLWENAGPAEWMSAPAGVLAFARGGAQCWVNTGADDVELPANVTPALSSTPGVTGCVPPDTTVWLVEG